MQSPVFHAHELPPGWPKYPGILDGYRVNYTWKQSIASIFSRRHNEFWMIWTDLAPLLLLLLPWTVVHFDAVQNNSCATSKRLVLQAIVACRMCSLLYHVFNCRSLLFSSRLAFVDLAGIACNAWGCCWVGHMADTQKLAAAVCVASMYFCAACFVAVIINPLSISWMQSILVLMAVAGNIPCMLVLYTGMGPAWVRACLASGMLFFASGYQLFYRKQVVGRHSHACWHVATFLGQLSYLATTALDCDQVPFSPLQGKSHVSGTISSYNGFRL